MFHRGDLLFLAVIHQKLKKNFLPLRRIFFAVAPYPCARFVIFPSTKRAIQESYTKCPIPTNVPDHNIKIKYQEFCISIFTIVGTRVGVKVKKNSSERSNFFFQLLAINCQKQQIPTMEQNYDSLRYAR